MSSRRALLFFWAAFFASADQAGAQWVLDTEANLFYTDDVSLFSASRRLALMEDPTQPAVDVTGQGSDMVVEPQAELKRAFSSAFGRTELSVKAQGFVFATNPIYNHGTFRFEIEQDLTRSLMLRVNYYYAPDLFLARNTQRSTGIKADERVSTHIYSAHLEGRPTEDLTLRLLTRYGSRDYNAAFSNRDTTLWTVGPHVEWAAARWLDVTAGYHYERGLADGRNQPQAKDDVSYINHYLALGLMIKPMEDHAIFLGADYEHNIFTSTIVGDERRGEKEDIYQWELEYRRTLGPRAVFTAGFQRSVRVSNIPARSVPDNNTWLGLEYKF
jgi:hypothetical protein